MAFIRWKNNRAYLVHGVRKNGKVKQIELAYLGTRPEITKDLIQRVEEKYPEIKFTGRISRKGL